MLHLDPKVKGKHIKLGEHGWVKLDTLVTAAIAHDAQGKHVRILRKGGLPPLHYRGPLPDHVKASLAKENI